MMIDDGLIGVSGSIISISDRGVVLIDEAGRRVSRALSDLTALLITRAPVRAADGIGAAPPPDSDDTSGVERILRRLRATPAGVLETVDGQRFPGAFSTTAGQDDAIGLINTALASDGVEIAVAAGTDVGKPLGLVHVVGAGDARARPKRGQDGSWHAPCAASAQPERQS